MEQQTIAARRKALGLSQSDLAEELGVSQAAVSRLENARPTDRRFELAIEALENRRPSAAAKPRRTPSPATDAISERAA